MRNDRSETRKRPRRWFRRYRALALLGSIILSATLWFAFQHKPGWYRPVALNEEIIQRARRAVPNLVDSISDHLVRRRSIEIMLREREVNEWLAALPRAWPEARDALPPELTRLAVRFTEDGVRVGGHMTASGWQVILGVTLSVALVDGGDSVKIALTGVRGGSLPLPNLLIKPILDRALAQHARANRNDAVERSDHVMPAIRSADNLFDGIRFENRFEWPNGRRMFRVGRIALGEGSVVIRLDPL